jgi:molybdopterin converting factor small subunit
MATVWIPPLVQALTDGTAVIEAPGETVQEVMDNLENTYPGVTARLFRDRLRLHPGIAMSVDGIVKNEGPTLPIDTDSEIHFLPAITGG